MMSLAKPVRSWYQPPVPWPYLAGVLCLAVLVGAVAALGMREEPAYSSDRQQRLAANIGWPDGWIVADGPIEPGGESHRTETWLYASRGVAVRFLDGAEVKPPVPIDGALVGSRSEVRPSAFHRGMNLADIEQRLGEEGARLEPFESPYSGSEGYMFVRSALLITILDGRFFTAQTY